MNIPGVSVWKAANGIFIEYFWEYLWETRFLTSVFVLLRHNFSFPKLHLSLCLSFCVPLSLCYSFSFSLSLCLIVYTVSFSVPSYLSLRLQPQNLGSVRTSIWTSYLMHYSSSHHITDRNPTELIYPAGFSFVHRSSMELQYIQYACCNSKLSLITASYHSVCLLTAGSSWKLPNNSPRELNLSTTAAHSCLQCMQCSVVSGSCKWELFLLNWQNKCLMFTIAALHVLSVMHCRLVQHNTDTIWAQVSHVSCNLQLHPDIYKMAVQHVFDVNMSQSASLVNVARCFSDKHKTLTCFQILSGLLWKPSRTQVLKRRVCACWVSFCLATFGDTFWTTH